MLQGPGMINVSLTRPWRKALGEVRAELCALAQTLAWTLAAAELPAQVEEASGDLVVMEAGEPRKICGLSARAKSGGVLLHGCLLIEPDLDLMEAVLFVPRRQPAYRKGRSHGNFLSRVAGLAVPARRRLWVWALAHELGFPEPDEPEEGAITLGKRGSLGGHNES